MGRPKVLSAEVSEYREYLLNRFFEKGFHPRLLAHLRGPTASDEWESLEVIVMSDPDKIVWKNVLRGNGWGKYVP